MYLHFLKGHFCSRNYILRALLHAELFSEGTLRKLWATDPMFDPSATLKVILVGAHRGGGGRSISTAVQIPVLTCGPDLTQKKPRSDHRAVAIGRHDTMIREEFKRLSK